MQLSAATAPVNHTLGTGSFNTVRMQSDSKERFYRYFQQEATVLQEQMANLGNLGHVGGERSDAINHCLASISRLESEVSDASDYIPAYDQRAYAQAIKALSEKLQETRKQLAPKARFTFKATNKNNSAISLSDAAELAQTQRPRMGQNNFLSSNESSMATTPLDLISSPGEPATDYLKSKERDTLSPLPSFPGSHKDYNLELLNRPSTSSGKSIRKPSFSQAKNIVIADHTGLHIILPASASRATSSGSISNLERCIVDMSIPTSSNATSETSPTTKAKSPEPSPFAGLALKNLNNCVIIAGRVDGAAHITDVTNSIVVVDARQVRIHNSKNVDVYLWCGSRPIIEGCSEMRFAQMPECYASYQQTPNQWNQIDDFKHLKAEPSPNFSLLPEDKRLPESIWTDVVPGGPTLGLDDILRKVGVLKS